MPTTSKNSTSTPIRCHVLCDNDSVEAVVIGTDEYANWELESHKDRCLGQCIRRNGTGNPAAGIREFKRHYWHIHNVPVYYQPEEPDADST